jgi:hypothetical protein
LAGRTAVPYEQGQHDGRQDTYPTSFSSPYE